MLTEKHVVGAPDLVVEVGSPGTRRTDERVEELTLESGDVLTTPLLSGLQLPLSEIFED